ncbi:chondroitin AC/alginate lyase [Obba rivulosa]|uniref:Chondroitin AC/alginate lyase n=1 Tax=Obba rivulosa TaxID=1052685 RepID=A0A8E2DV95_9APHY|nr:chondroitin AC/alginate lyase [Obba rivulosa]
MCTIWYYDSSPRFTFCLSWSYPSAMLTSLDHITLYCAVLAAAGSVLADSNDWVNIQYVLKQAGGSNSDTSAARQNIISNAGSTAKQGPWSVITKNKALPPSGNTHDYLSWAPYHWPDCNWCSKGTTHLSNPDDPDDGDDDGSDPPDADPGAGGSNSYEDGGSDDGTPEVALFVLGNPSSAFVKSKRSAFDAHHRMMRRRRELSTAESSPSKTQDLALSSSEAELLALVELPAQLPVLDILSFPSSFPTVLPTQPPAVNAPTSSTTQSSIGTVAGTPAPAEAPAKTQSSKCTPSPTRSLAPSATWTTCPYFVHDGKVNPDVRTIPDSPAVVDMTQSTLYNALAYTLQKAGTYSQNAATFIDTWFLSSATAMHPNMNFGQLVRGPGPDHQVGTFTGVLDLRGLVKVVNAIQLLKGAGSPDWTAAREKAMTTWMNQYISWLQTSDIGKETASKVNNHLSFYINQFAAAKMYTGDTAGATTALKNYFSNQFLDQIAASGEQPFEAVRTRPYHYRCFNLEAMITNAKLGDQLGLDLWTAKSKYGSTIQTALDYTMGLDPKGEDVSDIFPHVAAVAAAYGDPKGKYAGFLQKNAGNYKSQPFWFYDQTIALSNAPAAKVKHSRGFVRSLLPAVDFAGMKALFSHAVVAVEDTPIPFTCPAVFDDSPEVEIDDGIFVTCDELKPFYELPIPPWVSNASSTVL